MTRSRIDCALKAQGLAKKLVLTGLCFFTLGCQADSLMVGDRLDVRPPASWRVARLNLRPVPGEPIAAWSGPQGSTLIVYRALPIPGGTPESIATTLVHSLTNLPGIEIQSRRVQIVDGRAVARVEIIGPGTGDALAPSSTGKPTPPPGKSLIPTRELILGLPGREETLYFSWGIPESGREQLLPEIEATIASLRLPPDDESTSKYRE